MAPMKGLNAVFNLTAKEEIKIKLTKVLWKKPHIAVADAERLMLMKYFEKNSELEIPFRNWKLHEYPLLEPTRQHMWTA